MVARVVHVRYKPRPLTIRLYVALLLVLIGISAYLGYIAVTASKSTDPSDTARAAFVASISGKEEAFEAGGSGLGNTGFHGYRVGDIFKFGLYHWSYDNGSHILKFHRMMFPGSIASEYLKRVKFIGRREKKAMRGAMDQVCPPMRSAFLEDVIRGEKSRIENVVPELREGQSPLSISECFEVSTDGVGGVDSKLLARPTKNTAVVHLRVGDVMGSWFARLSSGVASDVYTDIAKRAKQDGVERAVLIGGVHRTPDPSADSQSVQYVRRVAEAFEDQGIRTVMISNTPDMDLCILADADYYVYVHKSGFSSIPAILNKKRRDWVPVNASKNVFAI